MGKHEELDRSVEDAGHALGKSPEEIDAAKRNAHRAVESGQVPEEVAEAGMEMIKEIAEQADPTRRDGSSYGDEDERGSRR